ncbi:hypothetical protein P1X14_07405 [Sphingomonas sp. AOB5]|uniref:hypothetical protein n=1 Tax=Sphingomonas sp. AOB5 TaxID=3034017 RepID=UPI0023F66584|nr:hypothetical protein [Sphingomonas sp. AOB5]MDF7775067.1 hypothetical protein [Sphingomonas sp. AOB5]
MRPGITQMFRDAAAFWHADRDLLLRIAGVFYLLPSLAMSLFLPNLVFTAAPTASGLSEAQQAAELAAQQAELLAWFGNVWPWLMSGLAFQLLGTTIVMTMILSPDRPVLGDAIRRALVQWPNVVIGWLLASIACTLGLFAFILPGFYLAGRTYLTSAAIVAEKLGPVGGLFRGVQLSKGHGWLLTSAYLAILLLQMFAAQVLGGALAAVPSGSVFFSGLIFLLASMVSAAASLASTLVQIAAYRTLSAPRQGM